MYMWISHSMNVALCSVYNLDFLKNLNTFTSGYKTYFAVHYIFVACFVQ